MNKYIATFGCGQAFEGYYIEIKAESYRDAVNYMEHQYNGQYCMVYEFDHWTKWEIEANRNGFLIESKLESVEI